MDNNININKPGDDKFSEEKKFPNLVGVETETSEKGITSASNARSDQGRVTRSKVARGASGIGDGSDDVKIQNKEDDETVTGKVCAPAAVVTGVAPGDGKGETEERQEEDIEVDDAAEQVGAGDASNSGNESGCEGPKTVNCQQDERQEEDIEVDKGDEVQLEPFVDSNNQDDIDTENAPQPEVTSSVSDKEEGQEASPTYGVDNKLNDLNKHESDEEAANEKQSEVDGAASKAAAGNSEEEIEVDDSDEGLAVANDSDGTQEYSMKNKSYINYQDKDFNTDSDLDVENSSDSNNQAAFDKIKDKRKGATADPMGQSASKKGKAGGSSRTKSGRSSSEEEDAPRPWRDDVKDTRRRKKDDENLKTLRKPPLSRLKRQWSDHDTQMYRKGYPGKKENPKHDLNLRFYKNEVSSRPNGGFIDEIHENWWDDLDLLESHHGYIQWLFPIRESGMNWHAQELQKHEAEAIQKDEKAMKRFVKSYEMMLNFYGLKLVDEKTGKVERASNWKQRFRHLNFSMHNYLRITRILKCLGEMGLEHYKAPFLRKMLHEAIVEGTLERTLDSCYNYWIGTLRDDKEREEIKKMAEELYEKQREVD